MDTLICKERTKEIKTKQVEWLSTQKIINIPTCSIKLENPIHKFANVNFSEEISNLKHANAKIINPVIVQYNEKDNRYHLINGLKSYHLARALYQNNIPAVIIDFGREKYCKIFGIHDKRKYGFRNINSIIIPINFIEMGVNKTKIQENIEYYNKYGCMDKPIILKDRVCKDGYSRLVASQWLGLNRVWVQYI